MARRYQTFKTILRKKIGALLRHSLVELAFKITLLAITLICIFLVSTMEGCVNVGYASHSRHELDQKSREALRLSGRKMYEGNPKAALKLLEQRAKDIGVEQPIKAFFEKAAHTPELAPISREIERMINHVLDYVDGSSGGDSRGLSEDSSQ